MNDNHDHELGDADVHHRHHHHHQIDNGIILGAATGGIPVTTYDADDSEYSTGLINHNNNSDSNNFHNNDLEMEELNLKEVNNDDGADSYFSPNSSFFIVNYFNSIQKEIKYTVHLAIGFLLIFFGFSPTQNLMSVIHPDDGTIGLGLLYFFFAIGCFVSPLFCKKVGIIKSLFLSGICYSIFIFCSTPTLKFLYFPASILIGLAASVLWTGQPTYISRAAKNEKELGKYSGIFNSIYTCGGITGNAASGILNSSGVHITTVLIIFGTVTFIGSILVGLVRTIPSKVKEQELNMKETLYNVFICFKYRPIQLLFPLLSIQGLSQGYFFSVIPSMVGLEQTGFVMTVFGVVAVIGSFGWGAVHDRFGKSVMVNSMFCILPASLLLCGLAAHYDHKMFIFYIVAGLNGAFDSLQNIYIFAIISTLYPTDNISHYSITRFLQSLCTAISFFTFGRAPLLFVLILLFSLLIISTLTQNFLLKKYTNKNKQPIADQTDDVGVEAKSLP